METNATKRLRQLIGFVPGKLSEMDETAFSQRPAPGKWSPKEIIGHLVDSAANNHHRFIRAQYEEHFAITRYNQDEWVRLNNYQQLGRDHVLAFWEIYNRQLLAVIENIPEMKLNTPCFTADGSVTLGWLIDDYVTHLEHHLRQLLALP